MKRKPRKEVRRSELVRLLVLLFLLPLLITLLFSVAFSLSAAQPIIPPVWLLCVSLAFPALLACVLFALSRAIIFAFFRSIALRVCHSLNIEIKEKESVQNPFMLFHAGQEFEIIAETTEIWRTDLANALSRMSSPGGLWALDAHIRFPFANAAAVYRNKSQELKKIKAHQNVRPAAVLAFFIRFQEEERLTPRKRLELLSSLSADALSCGEQYGGVAAEVTWNALWLVFSSGSDAQTCATGALRAAKEIYDRALQAHPGAHIRVLADYFPVCESMFQAGKSWRYHAESPDIAALRIAATSPVTAENCGLRFSSRIVDLVRPRGGGT
jgi:hypothetical protein